MAQSQNASVSDSAKVSAVQQEAASGASQAWTFYNDALAQLSAAMEQGDTDQARAQFMALQAIEVPLQGHLEQSLAAVFGVAAQAMSKPGFRDAYTSATSELGQAAGERLHLQLLVADYLINVTADSRNAANAQINRVRQVMPALLARLAALRDQTAGMSSAPVLVVTQVLRPLTVAPGALDVVEATVKNIGGATAYGNTLRLTLGPESAALILRTSDETLPILIPGQEVTVQWQFRVLENASVNRIVYYSIQPLVSNGVRLGKTGSILIKGEASACPYENPAELRAIRVNSERLSDLRCVAPMASFSDAGREISMTPFLVKADVNGVVGMVTVKNLPDGGSMTLPLIGGKVKYDSKKGRMILRAKVQKGKVSETKEVFSGTFSAERVGNNLQTVLICSARVLESGKMKSYRKTIEAGASPLANPAISARIDRMDFRPVDTKGKKFASAALEFQLPWGDVLSGNASESRGIRKLSDGSMQVSRVYSLSFYQPHPRTGRPRRVGAMKISIPLHAPEAPPPLTVKSAKMSIFGQSFTVDSTGFEYRRLCPAGTVIAADLSSSNAAAAASAPEQGHAGNASLDAALAWIAGQSGGGAQLPSLLISPTPKVTPAAAE